MSPKTMFEKIWDAHVVHQDPGQDAILYVDLHLVHEVTSPQAFEGLRLSGRPVRRPELTVATVDHSIPTWERSRLRRIFDRLSGTGVGRGITLTSSRGSGQALALSRLRRIFDLAGPRSDREGGGLVEGG